MLYSSDNAKNDASTFAMLTADLQIIIKRLIDNNVSLKTVAEFGSGETLGQWAIALRDRLNALLEP